MSEKQEKLSNEKYGFKQAVRRLISRLKGELNEHLDSINENTNEIQANYEYIQEMDRKVEKLKLRLDNVELFLNEQVDFTQTKKETIKIQQLSVNEKLAFMALYTSNSPVSYFEISEKIGISESLVRSYIINLIEKGVPIVKKYINGKPFIELEPKFKELQTKQNIVKIQQKQISSF
tara:strand:+ start:48 stop:578 length:531 start_codon:yes stop_codon:yes gene_type:complete